MASIISKVKQAYQLFKHIDLDQITALASKIDLGEVAQSVSKLDDKQLAQLMKMLHAADHKERPLPPIEGDFYHLSHVLTKEERELQLRVRDFMETEVKPLVNHYWLKAEFPFEIIPKLAALNICGTTCRGYGCPNLTPMMEGMLAMELARVDTSISTFFGVQSGLVMGSIYMLGSDEQKKEWLPDMQQFKKIGAFGLTEPEVGSAVAAGLTIGAKKISSGHSGEHDFNPFLRSV